MEQRYKYLGMEMIGEYVGTLLSYLVTYKQMILPISIEHVQGSWYF